MTEDASTSLAVAIGRLEVSLQHVSETVGNMDKKLDQALTDVAQVKQDQAVTRRDVDDLQDWREKAAARKPPWTAIGATLIAAAAFLKTTLFPS